MFKLHIIGYGFDSLENLENRLNVDLCVTSTQTHTQKKNIPRFYVMTLDFPESLNICWLLNSHKTNDLAINSDEHVHNIEKKNDQLIRDLFDSTLPFTNVTIAWHRHHPIFRPTK